MNSESPRYEVHEVDPKTGARYYMRSFHAYEDALWYVSKRTLERKVWRITDTALAWTHDHTTEDTRG